VAGLELTPQRRRELLARLARVEGQARGVRRMIEEGRDCTEVVQQIAAMRAALGRAAAVIVAENLEECLRQADAERVRRAKKTLLELI
jgi:DNA-binding FrmR family transcriptional regulator